MVRIVVNGDEREVAPGTTVLGLLEAMERHPRTVAVEHNREILPRERYGETALAAGDVLEIVGFVQGGCGGNESPPGPVLALRRAVGYIA